MSIPCRNCSSTTTFFSRFVRDRRWYEELSYYKCLACFAEFHTSLDHPEEWYQSGEYRDRAALPDESYCAINKRRYQKQVRWLDLQWPAWRQDINTVLDVGAFRGTGTQFLRDLGLEATGYEIDSHEAEKSEFVTSEFPTPETEYDMLWFSHVLEHVPSAIDMLKQWREFAPSAFVEIPPGNYQLPHILVFDQTSFRKTVEQSGWSIQIMDGTIYAILRRT